MKFTQEQMYYLKKFFTIEKKEFNYFSQKLVNKKYRFYYKNYLPPLWEELINPLNKQGLGYRGDYIDDGQKISFRKNKISDEIKKRFADNIKLQNQILSIIKKRIKNYNYKCGIIKVKTGMGKSIITMDIIEYLQKPTLILVSNKKLMQEMIDKFKNMSNATPFIGQYGGNKKEFKKITVITKKSFDLCEDKEKLRQYECIIIDECHQGFTKKFRDKFNQIYFGKNIFLYGLSATPSTNELNEQDLEKYFGKIIEIKKDYDFIPKFIFYNYQTKNDYEFEHYSELRTLLAEDKTRRKKQQEILETNLSKKCSLILCDRLEEVRQWYLFLAQENFEKYLDYNIIKITGETKIEDDKRQLEEALKNGKPTIIIGSIQKTSTGFDYPIIDTVFLFSAIKFENTVIQSVGRALRKAPGKTGAVIHIWNDKILNKQRLQKEKAIKEEYGIDKKEIKQIWINKEKKQKANIVLEF